MNQEEFSIINIKSNNEDSMINQTLINLSIIDSIQHKIYLNKLLSDASFDKLFENSKKTQSNIYDSLIHDLIMKKSYYKSNSIIFNDISTKIKKIYHDKNFSVNLINNEIISLFKNGESADEILNEITFIYSAKKTLEFYSFKSIKDLIIRTTKINKEQVPDHKLRSIYFQFKTLNEDSFIEKDYQTLRHLIDGPEQMRRPLDTDYGHYRYLPIKCKDYCNNFFAEFYNELCEEYKEFINELKLDKVVFNSFISELKNYFLKNCVFAHNINEMSYHPFKYLTKYCKNKYCQYKDCSFSHEDKNEQLLNIYNRIQFEQIRNGLIKNLAQQSSIINYQIDNPNNYFKEDSNPSPILVGIHSNFEILKTSECKKKNLCGNIKNCPFYHSLLERRRNPELYPIKNNQPCDKVFTDGKWKNPKLCENEDSCPFFHTRNELMYDTRNYKRLYECYIEKNKGTCDYYKICPYKHIIDVDVNGLYLPDNNKNKISELLSQYYSYLNDTKKLKQRIVKKNFICNNCKNYIQDKMILFSCGHNCCAKCIQFMKDCHFMCLQLKKSNLQLDKDFFVIDLVRTSEEKEKFLEFSCEEIDNFYEFYSSAQSDEEEQGSWYELAGKIK